MQTVFVVEDDDSIREMMMYALDAAGFATVGFDRGDRVLPALAEHRPALLLLDIMLPGRDGLTILRELRRADRYGDVPVILLTARDSEVDRVRGLDLGADDYITKPFSVMEAVSRVKAVLRRAPDGEDTPDELRAGPVALSPGGRTVKVDGRGVSLTYKEFELLYCLMRNQGIVLSRDALLDQVWGFDYGGESRTVDMHIKALRQKLGAAGALIQTVRSVGYKMEG